jgi:transcriptional regulator with XRE-family HTH domain
MSNSIETKQIHEGRNVKRFREMMQMNQDVLADALGEDWTQKKVSLLEAKETIEPKILEQVAKALKVPVEALKNFDEEAALTNIQSNYDSSVINAGPTINYKCTLVPDKVIELYERMLKEKDDLIEKLMKK